MIFLVVDYSQAEFPKPAGSRLGIQLSLVGCLSGTSTSCKGHFGSAILIWEASKVNTPDREGLVVEKAPTCGFVM